MCGLQAPVAKVLKYAVLTNTPFASAHYVYCLLQDVVAQADETPSSLFVSLFNRGEGGDGGREGGREHWSVPQ